MTAVMDELRAAHRRRRLREVARTAGTVTPEQLRELAHAEGLEPTPAQCRAVLVELGLLPRRRPAVLADAVLASARALPQPFTLSELVVSCWRADPLLFSLKGFTQFPGEHRVRCCLFGARGLLGCGHLVRDGDFFRVADTPAAELARLLTEG